MVGPTRNPSPGTSRFDAGDDGSVVERCIKGQPAAWQLLLDRHGPWIHEAAGYTLRRVLGAAKPEDVENVAQGVLLGLCDRNFHRLRLYQGRSTFRTWITSVTTRFALNYIRTEKRKGSLKLGTLDDSAPEIQAPGSDRRLSPEERDLLARGFEKLSSRERLLLKLFYFDEMSYRDIARVLRMPVNSVSPLLARARESLKEGLARE